MKEIMENIASRVIKKYHLTGVCPRYFEDLCELNGWKFDLNPDYNGRQVDWWATITIDNAKTVNVHGIMYNGTADLYLKKYE